MSETSEQSIVVALQALGFEVQEEWGIRCTRGPGYSYDTWIGSRELAEAQLETMSYEQAVFTVELIKRLHLITPTEVVASISDTN